MSEDYFKPNAADENGEHWSPWDALGLSCCSYNSKVDDDALAVLRGILAKQYNSDIAAATGLSPSHVELYQSIFSGAHWCEYGTSPRGCWFVYDRGENFGERLIAAWEAYYERRWGEAPKPI